MKTEILLFVTQFGAVFGLGIQSLNVQARNYWGSSTTSLLIGVMQLFVWKKLPEASLSQSVAWLLAGPVAIMAAIWLHPKIFRNRVDADAKAPKSPTIKR